MWRRLAAFCMVLALGGCAGGPGSKPVAVDPALFQPVAGKAVIFVVRTAVDSDLAGPLLLDDKVTVSTMPGTYHRWVVDPGPHRIEGMGGSGIRLVFETAPGGVYYLRHSVYGSERRGPAGSALQQVDAAQGQELIMRAEKFP